MQAASFNYHVLSCFQRSFMPKARFVQLHEPFKTKQITFPYFYKYKSISVPQPPLKRASHPNIVTTYHCSLIFVCNVRPTTSIQVLSSGCLATQQGWVSNVWGARQPFGGTRPCCLSIRSINWPQIAANWNSETIWNNGKTMAPSIYNIASPLNCTCFLRGNHIGHHPSDGRKKRPMY